MIKKPFWKKQFLCNLLTGHFKSFYIQPSKTFSPFSEKVQLFSNAKCYVKSTHNVYPEMALRITKKQTNNK